MCGITGICNLTNKPVEKQVLLAMTEKIRHRGPDASGVFLHENFGLGHTRLSVIDLSEAGRQPMQDEHGDFTIVFNGEIYNFQEVRNDLRSLGYKFRSKTDTEVILNSYKCWGKECLAKFNGMFAFAIFDKAKKQLFLARDRMGEKPLYYYIDNEKFVFASEIKSILECGIKKDISRHGLANYFIFGHSIAPDTIFNGVKKLLPGHFLILAGGGMEIGEYWDIPKGQLMPDKGENYYLEGVKNALLRSVQEKLVSDVPLGVFLSGGIDSGLVTAMMARSGAGRIKTFSVGFDVKGGEFNELPAAKITANYFKTEHHEMILKEIDLADKLNDIVYHFDEPFGDAASFPLFCMSDFAKKYVSVVLTGEGGDELFGGYRRYLMEKYRKAFLIFNDVLDNGAARNILHTLPGLRRLKKFVSAFSEKEDLKRYVNWISFFSPDAANDILVQKNIADPLSIYKNYADSYKHPDWLQTLMDIDQKIMLPDGYLEKVDKTTMAFGLESRAPFLDHRLVEFANLIPSRYKLKGLETKSVLRKLAREFLPEKICRMSKRGFAVPTAAWLKVGLKNYAFEIIFDQKTRSRGYLNFDYINKIYKKYKENNQPLDSQLWLILNFELWNRQFMDK